MEKIAAVLWCVVVAGMFRIGTSQMLLPSAEREVLSGLGQAVAAILEGIPDSKCIPIFFIDGTTSHVTVMKELGQSTRNPWGVGVFEVAVDGQDANVTQAQLSRVVDEARRLRRLSWCVMVVVASNDPTFLTAYAQKSLKGRLLVWETRQLLVTSYTSRELRAALTSHWTFSMTNTMLMNVEYGFHMLRCGVYVYLPYSPRGAKVVEVAYWTFPQGLVYIASLPLFPEKFSNFYGSTVNVTALPYAPYWMTSGEGNNTKHYGIDYNQITTLAQALNFKFFVLPSANWDEVTDQVEARKSFIASIVYVVLPNRLEKYDFTHTFDYSPFCFGMAKPTLKPQWQSLYYPLANEVWAAVIATAVVECVALLMIIRVGLAWKNRHGGLDFGAVIQEVIGTLLGQGFTGKLSTSRSNRLLVALWLVFAFILGTAYRGNLTASLTLPKYPPRPETVEELVKHIDRATIEPYGISYKQFFTKSESKVFSALGKLMAVGVNIIDGYNDALKMKRVSHFLLK
ncbi:glutamate receptor 2-like [Homarus americanus]|nr:glutamate receptor 2-like [Homarus americanus]